MKKIICAILCLSIVLTGIIGITAASADTYTTSYTATIYRNGIYCWASKGTTSVRSGYKRVSVNLNMSVTFERGSGLSNAGTWYSVSATPDSASGNTNTPARNLFVSLNGKNPADIYKSGSAGGTIVHTR